MTRKEVMDLLATADADLTVYEAPAVIRVTVEDFLWSDDWEEIDREYDSDLVDSIQERLESCAISSHGDFYHYYEFDGFVVVWGYASFDI